MSNEIFEYVEVIDCQKFLVFCVQKVESTPDPDPQHWKVKICVADPWHFGTVPCTDPYPRIRASD